jgi:hypothetical protein
MLKDYPFTMLYYQPGDICVSINETLQTADEFSLIPDINLESIPANERTGGETYGGGIVQLADFLPTGSTIKIFRKIALPRFIDYQATAPTRPEDLNKDLNHIISYLGDLIGIDADLPAMRNLLDNVAAIQKQIDALKNFPNEESLNDIVQSMQAMLDAGIPYVHENGNWWIGAADTGKSARGAKGDKGDPGNTGPAGAKGDKGDPGETGASGSDAEMPPDYITEWQNPTSGNDYAWYRKYASGWCEQGGVIQSDANYVYQSLPVEMADLNYSIEVSLRYAGTIGGTPSVHGYPNSTSQLKLGARWNGAFDAAFGIYWVVKGVSAS